MDGKALTSKIFPVKTIDIANTEEFIVLGGRDKISLLPDALKGISQIGVIGFKSQGRAQALCWRDSVKGTGIKVVVGLREDSLSRKDARALGFTEENGTLGEVYEVIGKSDLVIILIEDAAQVKIYKDIFAAIKPGATLGFSHGFLLGYLDSIGETFPDNINVIGVCPKGMGNSVRRLYEQGYGINCSFAVEQNVTGNATDIALAWATALGAPFAFQTTLRQEYISDLFGERGVLLGKVFGDSEALYSYFTDLGYSKDAAFAYSAENITGPMSEVISKKGGLLGVYNGLTKKERRKFDVTFSAAYNPFKALMTEIYQEVASGNEIRSVVMAGEREKTWPMSKIGTTGMWEVGEKYRLRRSHTSAPHIHPVTAAIYLAGMTVQCDILRANGHRFTEIANESIIELTDSLIPYMHFNGVATMVDGCSKTARYGARKWAPRFHYVIAQEVLPWVDSETIFEGMIEDFVSNPVHDALAVCSEMRPPVDISVVG